MVRKAEHGVLTGTRIRERRIQLGVKQSTLARTVGISPSYLNLIEHNRRRIGGKVLLDIAQVLQTDVGALSEGAEVSLLNALRAAADGAQVAPDLDEAEEIAGRFPQWAALIAEQAARVEEIEQTVAALSDRMTHDPFLSASLHEMLSTVTAIRSTAGILAGPEVVEPVWQDRFHKNIMEEAVRLADASQELVNYLDAPDQNAEPTTTPQEEVDAYLMQRDYVLPEVEAGKLPDGFQGSRSAQALLERYAQQYRAEAARLPAARLIDAVTEHGVDPLAVSLGVGMPIDVVMRRLAQVPLVGVNLGLVECDPSGTLTFRRPLQGFPLPRYGAACPLWPLFSALSRPNVPIAQVLRSLSGQGDVVQSFTVAVPQGVPGYGEEPVLRSTMLLVARDGENAEARDVGLSCRICPRAGCTARREPAILTDGF